MLYAIRGGNEECAKLLIENGADATIEPNIGDIFNTAKVKFQSPKIRNLLRAFYLCHQMEIPNYMSDFEYNSPIKLSSTYSGEIPLKDPQIYKRYLDKKGFFF